MNELRKAIELEHVSFSYEDSDEQVLRNASMEVCYGEVALLCGFSGEGKSTVLSLISGIIPDVTPGEVLGRVRVDGEDIAGKKLSSFNIHLLLNIFVPNGYFNHNLLLVFAGLCPDYNL